MILRQECLSLISSFRLSGQNSTMPLNHLAKRIDWELFSVYVEDIALWAKQQAEYLRSGQLDRLDIEHLADEIEDVGKSEQRELASRVSVLLAHLVKWQFQPDCRSKSWERTIKEQRKAIRLHLKEVPSLKNKFTDPDWIEKIWADAVALASQETGLFHLPESIPWQLEVALEEHWLP